MKGPTVSKRRPARGLSVRFLGGAGTVTGSKFLVQGGGVRVLVDCGMYQGLKQLRLRNWARLPFDVETLDAVVLTHAHIDHSGLLPLLVRSGFRGPIHATAPTADLLGILLPDSGHIQEEDAAYANRQGYSKHHPARPLYTEEDARAVLPALRPVAFGQDFAIGDLRVRLRHAGHILGAASVEIACEGRRVLFSGDLGRDDDPVCVAPEPPQDIDSIVMESTYGDRCHGDVDPQEVLARAVREVAASGGTLLIPSFAVGRAQNLLYWFDRLFDGGRAPRLPLVVDSPMATSVTELYRRHHADHRLDAAGCERIFGGARFVRRVEESKALADESGPRVLISASGMLTGGRVLHHFKRVAPDPSSVILLPGFQAAGTRGAALVAGAEEIKMHGGYVRVRARVEQVDAFSAHADRRGLLAWLASASRRPSRVVLVHGEPVAADSLRRAIEEEQGLKAVVAEHGARMTLGVAKDGRSPSRS